MSTEARRRPARRVLLVEDSPTAARLVSILVAGLDPPVSLHVVSGGEQALAALRDGEGGAILPRPGLVILDVHLPGMDGYDTLKAIKSDPALCSIPVVMLSASSSPQDIRRGYELGANAFVAKPDDLDGSQAMVHGLVDYWLGAVEPFPG